MSHVLRMALAAALLLGAWGAVWAQAAKPDFDLILHDAVVGANGAAGGTHAIVLDLRREGDRWERVWGIAGTFNTSWQYGFVTSSTEAGAALTLDLLLTVLPDGYKRDTGYASYKVILTKTTGDQYSGTFTGTCLGNAVAGKATATARPKPAAIPGVAPVQPGEHPRLLFRKSDLPALKAKAETPFGKAMLEKLAPDAIKLGVLYQLTGDAKYAAEAAAFAQRVMASREPTQILDSHHQSPQYGWYYEQVSMAYDLCYDAWTPEQRRAAENYITVWATRLVWHHTVFNTQVPRGIGNGEYMNMLHGAGLGTIARLGEKAPAPEKPVVPNPIVELPAVQGFTPPAGVPVNVLEPGKFAQNWLTLPAIPGLALQAPFADLASGKTQPTLGATVTVDAKPYAFAPLGADYIRPTGGFVMNVGNGMQPGHIKRAAGPEWPGLLDGPVTFVWYTVFDNAEPRYVKLNAGFTMLGKPDVYLAGHYLSHGQVVKLEKGHYPMLIVARILARWDTLGITLMPATEADLAGSTALMASLKQDHANRLVEWNYDRAQWERTGGANTEYTKMFQLFQSYVYRHIQEGVGLGGAQPDHSGNASVRELGSGRYASAYRKAMGRDLSPYDDLNVFLARKVFQRVYGEKSIMAQEPSGGPTDMSAAYFAFHWPFIPEKLKPAMLWAWQREFGINTEKPENTPAAIGGGHPDGPVYAFVNYPLDLKPEEPKGIMPLTWAAPAKGYSGFRNGWNGKDDFVTQVYAKSWGGKGYDRPNAGTFRIIGLGDVWADALPSLRLNNQRIFDPLVELTEDDTNGGAYGRVAYEKYETDGSGVVTIDMNDIYATAKKNAKGNDLSLFGPYGNVRNDDSFAPSGITGLRAFGVDYSGKSGAPCLFVLVDKIDGGKSKLWAWHLQPPEVDKNGKVVRADVIDETKVNGNTAVITQRSGNTMQLVAVSPAENVLKAEARKVVFTRTYNRGEGTYTLPALFLQGKDATAGHFFVVATIQPKGVAAPEVKVEGTGLDAKITVGKRTVTFDGTKVVFGDVR